jgi:hypothetical protein
LSLLAALALCAALPARARPVFGLSLDGGAPDGVGGALLVRPLSFLRFEGGVTTNLSAPGVRGGVVLSVPWYVSPALAVEAGYQWPGDANKTIALFRPNPNNALLRHLSYGYFNLHAGLELGHPDWVMLTLHAGYSYLITRTSGLADFVAQQDPTLHVGGETTLHVWTPSAKVGLIFYIP